MPTSELRPAFDALAATLRVRAAGRHVYFMVGDGNLGDGLIRLGAEHFLADIGLSPKRLDMNSKQAKLRALGIAAADPYGHRALFVHNGGGGWAEHCSVALRGVQLQMRACADVFVLPSTIETMPLERQPTLWRRDKSGSVEVMPDAPFCHDMAFYLALIPTERWYPGVAQVRVDREVGVFFRGDNESRLQGGNDLPGNLDISNLGTSVEPMTPFLDHIARCERVVTDRLHVGIAATLLGKDVALVGGKTWKIKAIHEASIAPYFTNCRLVTDNEALELARS